MHFPVEFQIHGLIIPAHLIMETSGYVVGSLLYHHLRNRFPRIHLNPEQSIWIIVGCLAGAALGARLLGFLESIRELWPLRHDPQQFFAAKTIVGGLAGGWIGVEIAKRQLGIRQSTGDRFVFPILIGLAVGRVGCFLEGLPDHTYGVATSLPWGVDFGDGIRRHPTQLYESLFALLLAAALWWRMRRPWVNGDLFRMMMLAYFAWRFAVEFIKPRETYGDLSPIQMTCAAGMVWCAWLLARSRHEPQAAPTHEPAVTQ